MGKKGKKLTRVDAKQLKLLIDIGLLLLDICGTIDRAGSHGVKGDAAITGVSNAGNYNTGTEPLLTRGRVNGRSVNGLKM